MTESDLQSDDTSIHEDGLWRDNGWTARIIKNEDDDGWAVEMIKDGESEPALVGPWTMGRDKKNPKPMDANAFRTLVKTATEVLMRHEQQRRAMLHKEVTVPAADGEGDVSVTLDIVPDEFEPYAQLKAFDSYGELLAEAKVSAAFKLNKASAERWVESGFARRLRGELAPQQLLELLRGHVRIACGEAERVARELDRREHDSPRQPPPAERGRREQRERLLPATAAPAAHMAPRRPARDEQQRNDAMRRVDVDRPIVAPADRARPVSAVVDVLPHGRVRQPLGLDDDRMRVRACRPAIAATVDRSTADQERSPAVTALCHDDPRSCAMRRVRGRVAASACGRGPHGPFHGLTAAAARS